jgi:S-DNA-T family DNA segregation ATPase FtsK/SpoIIIE
MSNFATRLTFNCTETSEYSNVFDRCQIRPKNLPGRGLVAIDKVVYEYQAFLPFDGETESRRIEQARAFMAGVAGRCGPARARSVPSIPPLLTEAYWQAAPHPFDPFVVPVGLTYSEIEPVVIDLLRVGTVGIYGREGFGKSNLVRTVMRHLQRHVFDLACEAYLVDGYDRQLSEFETYGFVRRFTVDCADFEEIVQTFSDAAAARMEILRMGGDLNSEPLLLCVVQNARIFATGAVSPAACDQLRKLAGDARQLRICFLFANVDNNADYAPSEVMKIARDFAQYFLLDDMANVKLFGSTKFTVNDLKPYKKAIALGDGYTYDARNGIEKIKLMKCEKDAS